ncbi:hypothetical protein [Streptomyces sp. NPDC097619]|uniref:hypothetical protein n=1 Tax=Streptomyces sp. NPDC097619 TaxID=3157228 RepID=UPI00331D48C5
MSDPIDGFGEGLLVLHATFPGAYVVTLRGVADWNMPESLLRDHFTRAADTGLRLVVDLGALEYGSEELLGLLLDARRAGGLELVGPLGDSFRGRLDRAGVTAWFTIHPTLTAALHP